MKLDFRIDRSYNTDRKPCELQEEPAMDDPLFHKTQKPFPDHDLPEVIIEAEPDFADAHAPWGGMDRSGHAAGIMA